MWNKRSLVKSVIVCFLRTKPFFFCLYRNGFYWKLKNLIKNLLKPKLPITTPKYKNLFCQTWKNVGSYTQVFTVLLQRKGKYIFLLKQSANSYPVQIRAYGQAYRRSCDNQNFSASWVFTFDFIVLMNQSQGIQIVISTSSNFSLTQGVVKPDTQISLPWHPHQGCLPFTGPYSGWKLIPCERRKC